MSSSTSASSGQKATEELSIKPQPPAADTKNRHDDTKTDKKQKTTAAAKVEVADNMTARARAKLANEKLNTYARKRDAYIPIKYEEDRIQQEALDIATVLELKQQRQMAAATSNNMTAVSKSDAAAAVLLEQQQQSMLLVGRRGTIGNATISPVALKIHPRGFKLLSASSPLERNMKSYFRLPPQPPAHVSLEHLKMRDKIKKSILAAEQKRLRSLSNEDAQNSMFGGTSTANTVSTTVTTTITRPSGAVETVTETIYGKQLDGFLLLENCVGLPGVTSYDQDGNPIYGGKAGSDGGGSHDPANEPKSTSAKKGEGGPPRMPMTVTERYYRDRERLRRKEERARAAHEKDLRRQAKLEAKLEKIRRREAALERIRNGGGAAGGEDTEDPTKTFLTGTKMHGTNDHHGVDDDDDALLEDDEESEEDHESSEEGDDSASNLDEDDEDYDELDLDRLGQDNDNDTKPPTDPSLAIEANINDRNLIGVVAEDLTFFTRLVFVDAGENRLLVSDFSKLPAIEELHMHCNALTQLSDLGDAVAEARKEEEEEKEERKKKAAAKRANGDNNSEGIDHDKDTTTSHRSGVTSFTPFLSLHSLNLSFNRIPAHELVFLAHLPSLTRLDLSNNNLKTISLDFALSAVPNVTHLALEGNKFKNALHVFSCLAVMPSLVEVNLNDNSFEAIPSTTEMLSYLPPPPRNSGQALRKNDDSGGNETKPSSDVDGVSAAEDHYLLDEGDSYTPYAIFPCLTALGIADNKLQFVEDVFPVIQFPQLRRVVLWGNPLVRQSKDVAILTQELSSAGISEIILDHPSLPKRHPQDFYSIRPPARNEQYILSAFGGSVGSGDGNKKKLLSGTFTKAKRGHVVSSSKSVGGSNADGIHPLFEHQREAQQITSETVENVQHIFDSTATTSSSSTKICVNGPGGAFIRLPAEIHSDYTHIKGLKGQGLAQHSLPTVLPSDRLRKKKMKQLRIDRLAAGGGAEEPSMLGSSDIPTTISSRLRSGKFSRVEDDKGHRHGVGHEGAKRSSPPSSAPLRSVRPPAGTFSSLSAPTTSAKFRSEVVKEEQNELRRRIAEEERWLPAIDANKYGDGGTGRRNLTLGSSNNRLSGRGISPLSTSFDVKNNASGSGGSIPYYLGGSGGGVTDGSTTQQALNELRRLLKK